ncbi:MAG TPA: DUF2865 domain-containing protein [Hyphomicrobiaceae bacterium]|nr:DUF2865 domain-containing protein [Hyphomicrobiaceae bacterium]
MFGQLSRIRQTLIAVTAGSTILSLGVLAFGMHTVVSGGTSTTATPVATGSDRTGAQHGTNKLAEAIGFDMSAGERETAVLAIEDRASSVETQSEWGEQLRESKYFERLRTNRSANWRSDGDAPRRSGLLNAEPGSGGPLLDIFGRPVRSPSLSAGAGGSFTSGTFRTVCVRTCDGFYWPISFATTKDNFPKDQETCERSCGGAKQARLFVYRNPGEQTEDMEDLDGKPYKQTATAFQFRASYNESCKCRAHPWEEESKELHRTYAAEEALKARVTDGDKRAKSELKALRQKREGNAARNPKSGKSSSLGDKSLEPSNFSPGQRDDKRRMTKAGPPLTVAAIDSGSRLLSKMPDRVTAARLVPQIVVTRYVPHSVGHKSTGNATPATPASPRRDAELHIPQVPAHKVVQR